MIDRPLGEMWQAERDALHKAILDHKPYCVVETGGKYGQGSTFEIASALRQNGQGRLFTVEPDVNAHQGAQVWYSDKPEREYIHFVNATGVSFLTQYPKTIDFLFLDGAEAQAEGLREWNAAQPLLRKGSVFMMHDWLPEYSEKANLLRPILQDEERKGNWKIDYVLQYPASVGLIHATKL